MTRRTANITQVLGAKGVFRIKAGIGQKSEVQLDEMTADERPFL